MSRLNELVTMKDIFQKSGEVALEYYRKENDVDISDFTVSVYIQDRSKVKWKSPKTHFTKMYDKRIKELMEMNTIDITELGLLTLLASYTDYENNELKFDKDYMTQKDIVRLSGLSRNKIAQMLKKFEDESLLFTKKHPKDFRKKIYYISPEIFYKGTKIDKETKQTLQTEEVDVDKLFM